MEDDKEDLFEDDENFEGFQLQKEEIISINKKEEVLKKLYESPPKYDEVMVLNFLLRKLIKRRLN